MFEIYFFIVFAWILLIVGKQIMKDYAMTTISSFMIMTIGICIIQTGTLLMFAVGVCQLAMGFYFLIRSSIEISPKHLLIGGKNKKLKQNFKNGKENTRIKRTSQGRN